MLELVSGWDLKKPETAWIVKHASRGLLKAGHPGSFALFGFEKKPALAPIKLKLTKSKLRLGETLEFQLEIRSSKKRSQKLAIDYSVHYVKKNGTLSPKVFKLRELELAPEATLQLVKTQVIKDFSTRTHNPGKHRLEILVNGKSLAIKNFHLSL